jgi:hypothetical protein
MYPHLSVEKTHPKVPVNESMKTKTHSSAARNERFSEPSCER